MPYSSSTSLPHSSSTSFEARTYAKVTWRLLPFVFVCYCFAYLDRVNVGFAKLQMLNDLHMSETVYGLGAGIFFIGYFIFEVPSNILLHRIGARIWIARIMITWALISSAMVFVKTPLMFYVLRFLLGVAEAGFSPGILLLLTYWYPAHRRGRVTGFYMCGIPIAGIIGGPLSGWIMHSFVGVGNFANWQWLFLLEAVPSLIIGILTLFWLDNGIRDAKWLSEEEKRLLESEIATENREKQDYSTLQVFSNLRIWVMGLMYFCVIMGLYGVTFWLPTIIKASGVKDTFNIGLLSTLPNILAVMAIVVLSRSADKLRERRWHFAITSLVGAFGLAMSAVWSNDLTLAMITISIGLASVITLIPLFFAFPSAILSGAAAAVGIALTNCIGNIAGFASPYIVGWIKDLTHSTNIGMYMLSAFLVLGAFLSLTMPAKLVNK